jgi:hypothetical protein
MQQALRLHTTVLPGHRIEVSASELPEGSTVELIVMLPATTAATPRTILEFLDALPSGPRSFPTWEQFESEFQSERESWDR